MTPHISFQQAILLPSIVNQAKHDSISPVPVFDKWAVHTMHIITFYTVDLFKDHQM
jgi:hypothetical protein